MTPAGASNELDVQNEWEENTHTHTHIAVGLSQEFHLFCEQEQLQKHPTLDKKQTNCVIRGLVFTAYETVYYYNHVGYCTTLFLFCFCFLSGVPALHGD